MIIKIINENNENSLLNENVINENIENENSNEG